MADTNGIAPIQDESSAPYWAACAERRLLFQTCEDCGTKQFYPRAFCTACLGPNVTWTQASGSAALHTFSVVHRTSDVRFSHLVPYVPGRGRT